MTGVSCVKGLLRLGGGPFPHLLNLCLCRFYGVCTKFFHFFCCHVTIYGPVVLVASSFDEVGPYIWDLSRSMKEMGVSGVVVVVANVIVAATLFFLK